MESIKGDRFIPTCMGNAGFFRRALSTRTVHPHVHGERCVRYPDLRGFHGSSPRAWGTHALSAAEDVVRRFIPTCMGNALCSVISRESATVHPHVHGERLYTAVVVANLTGSSPRAWGTRCQMRLLMFALRFIPTCMGNAGTLRRHNTTRAVHPHVHGEREFTPNEFR